MKHVINLNDEIRVKLTDHGRSILYKFHQRIQEIVPSRFKGESVKFQLWEFMDIFGKHLWNGADQVIVNNEMEVL